jgi:monofunctional biosynthetic peptidoglycan transglycosylase
MSAALRQLARFVALLLVCVLALQLYFAARVALIAVVDPQSTSFQRSEIWRLLTTRHEAGWAQQWVDYGRISTHLKRAVIASEDAGFVDHHGVEWEAVQRSWHRNQQAEARAAQRLAAAKTAQARARAEPKLIGSSTITQQLAKNLFLGGERTLLRKGQELVITCMLEGLLSKQRILEAYLNSVEWGEGVFGAEAAARYYFRVPAERLAPEQAARLAVMLPAPKRFEKRPGSPYLLSRSGTIVARMAAVELP